MLPTEIIDCIFDHLSSFSDLLQWSLVCIDWLHLVRKTHGFQKIKVTTLNADSFASLVVNPSSTFPDSVRQLVLDLETTWFRRILPFAQLLTRVTALELRTLEWDKIDFHARQRFIGTFRSVITHLILGEAMEFKFLTETVELVAHFSHLENLSIDGARWRALSPPTNDAAMASIVADIVTSFAGSFTTNHFQNFFGIPRGHRL
ncbi:hypothetical protein CPB83DRAFT_89714 [Crepidotus variabilis]|uniref:F-box domain-containing protein n=1 Tax=Crepidotus variabilis TaxID=179855 RepID=A0A9P6E536_9AGAR|nr:hypothetical protein CPB83DRAFT_89714 [Crepidotus variabilis]